MMRKLWNVPYWVLSALAIPLWLGFIAASFAAAWCHDMTLPPIRASSKWLA